MLILLVGGYLATAGYLRFNEPKLLYDPVGGPSEDPTAEELGLPYEPVTFLTSDSVGLSAWIIPAAGNHSDAPWVLICHGNTGDVGYDGRPRYYSYLREVGVNQLAFDYRGFGESGGVITEDGFYRDARAAWDYLTAVRGVPPDRIVIFGHSLGSAVAIELATRVAAAGLVVEGAFTSVPERAREIYPYFPMRFVARSRYASIDRIDDVVMPKLFLHAAADSTIPIAHGQRLFAEAQEPKDFVTLRGGHTTAYKEDRAVYFAEFGGFIWRTAGDGLPEPAKLKDGQ